MCGPKAVRFPHESYGNPKPFIGFMCMYVGFIWVYRMYMYVRNVRIPLEAYTLQEIQGYGKILTYMLDL